MKVSLKDIINYCARLEISDKSAKFTEVTLDEGEQKILKDIIRKFNLETPQDFRYKLWKIQEYLLGANFKVKVKILYHLYKRCVGIAAVLKALRGDIERIFYDSNGNVYVIVNKKLIKTNIVLPEHRRIEVVVPSKIIVQIGSKNIVEGFVNPPLTTDGVFLIDGVSKKTKIVQGRFLLEIPPLEKPGKYLGKLVIETPSYAIAREIYIRAKGCRIILNIPATVWVNEEIEASGAILCEKLPKSLKIFLNNNYLADCMVNKNGSFNFTLPAFSKSGIFHLRLKGKNVDIEKKLLVQDLIIEINAERESTIEEGAKISGNITVLPEKKPFRGNVSIKIPDANIEDTISVDGSFSYEFRPEKIGNYKVIVSVKADGKEFRKTAEIRIGKISLSVKHPSILFEGDFARIYYEVVPTNASPRDVCVEVFVNGKRIYRGSELKYVVTEKISGETQVEVIAKRDEKILAKYKGTIRIIKMKPPEIPKFLRIGEKYKFEVPPEIEVSCENCEVLSEEGRRIVVIGPYPEGEHRFKVKLRKNGLEKELVGTVYVEGVVIEANSRVKAKKVRVEGKILGKQSRKLIDDVINITIRKSGKVVASGKINTSGGYFVKEFELDEGGLYNIDIVSERYKARYSLEVSIRSLDVECSIPKEVTADVYLIKGRAWLVEKEKVPLSNKELIMEVEGQKRTVETNGDGYFETEVRLPKDKDVVKLTFKYKDLLKTVSLRYSKLEIISKISRTTVNPAEGVSIKVVVRRKGEQEAIIDRGIVTCEVLDDKGKMITSRSLKYDNKSKCWVGTIIAPPLPGVYPIKIKVRTSDGIYGEAML